jgi:hypothetical protein
MIEAQRCSEAAKMSIEVKPSEQDIRPELNKVFTLLQLASPHAMEALKHRHTPRTAGEDDRAYFERLHSMYQGTYFKLVEIARKDLGFTTEQP